VSVTVSDVLLASLLQVRKGEVSDIVGHTTFGPTKWPTGQKKTWSKEVAWLWTGHRPTTTPVAGDEGARLGVSILRI
jgi:hypothetical protein